LSIKTNVVKRYVPPSPPFPLITECSARYHEPRGTSADYRLAKEVTSDIQESEDRQKDLDRIRDSGADGADIRNAVSHLSLSLYTSPPA
jgi:hypothetical protein